MSRRLVAAGLLAGGLLALTLILRAADTPRQKDDALESRVYPVADLVRPAAIAKDDDKLLDLIQNHVCPQSWRSAKGRGTLDYLAASKSLVIRQSAAIHEQVTTFLAELRKHPDQDVQIDLRVRIPGSGMNPKDVTRGTHRCLHPCKQGTLVNTGNHLDVAIEGAGFFEVTTPNGERRYTRDGGFHIDAGGHLVTGTDCTVEPRITVPPDAISISIGQDGTVSTVTVGASSRSVVAGQLTLTRFINPAGLRDDGENLLQETDAAGTAIVCNPGQGSMGLLRQGFLERSEDQLKNDLIHLVEQLAQSHGVELGGTRAK